MNNEHQGMKIGLISLTIVAIIFIGTTIFLFTKQKENQDRTVAAEQKASSSDSEMRKWMQEAGTLKKLIGPYSQEQPITDIEEKAGINQVSFSTKQGLRIQFPNSVERNYENLTAFLASAIERERQETTRVAAERDKYKQDLEDWNNQLEKRGEVFDSNLSQAQDDLKTEKLNYTDGLSIAKDQQTDTTARLDAAVLLRYDEVKKANSAQEQAEKDRDAAAAATEAMNDQLVAMRRPLAGDPSGHILFIDQGSGLVWINLGFADGLEVRTTFSVFDPAVNDVVIADRVHAQQVINSQTGHSANENICSVCLKLQKVNASKANIEVIEIKGPHSAVARILTDELANPVTVSDVIFTPVWQPGQRQKFALIGDMSHPQVRSVGDMTAMDVMRNLIETNGGEVVAWIDDEFNPHGTLDINTTFLVVGDEDLFVKSEKGKKQLEEWRKLAKMNGTIEVPLVALIRRMGYKQTSPITGFGTYAQEGDRDMIRPADIPSTSAGTISPLHSNLSAPMPSSTGKVSDLHLGPGTTGAPRQSSGTTSDLFRRRTIPGERTE